MLKMELKTKRKNVRNNKKENKGWMSRGAREMKKKRDRDRRRGI